MQTLKEQSERVLIYKTMKRYEIINYLISKYELNSYLEIGIGDGENWRKITAKDKTGVDPQAKVNDRAIHVATSDDFFAKNQRVFDIIFIDGLHEHEQVNRDIENSLKVLQAGGFIVIHDANPLTDEAQRVPREVKCWNGDVWKAVTDYNKNGEFGVITVDTDEGCAIIHASIEPKSLASKAKYNWINLERYRHNFLNLVSVEEFKEIL